MNIELDDSTLNELIKKGLQGSGAGFNPTGLQGKNVFVRTVTFHYTGKLVAENGTWLELEDAAWIADSGRFSTALKTGDLNEVEPFPNSSIRVSAATVVDVSEWAHDLPRTQV